MITRNVMPVFLSQNTYKAQKPMSARKENSASVQAMNTAPQQKLGFGINVEKAKKFVTDVINRGKTPQEDRFGITLIELIKKGEKKFVEAQEKLASKDLKRIFKDAYEILE